MNGAVVIPLTEFTALFAYQIFSRFQKYDLRGEESWARANGKPVRNRTV